jgi:hypothetical protein
MFDLKKAMELKKQMESVQEKLNNIEVEGKSGDGALTVSVYVTANRDIKNIEISQALIDSGNKDHIEDLVMTAITRAMDQAKNVAESEARSMAMGGFPGM